MTKSHSVTIIASGIDPTSNYADRFFDAGCDDATISFQKGLFVLDFDREARTFMSALMSALADVDKAGARIERVEPDHLVSASDIARRAGLARASVSLYSKGERGTGFPPPVARVTTETPLWDWVEVASWMYHARKLTLDIVLQAKMVREVNRTLVRRRSQRSYFFRRMQERRYVSGGGHAREFAAADFKGDNPAF